MKTREQLIDSIMIANGSPFSEDDREMLTALAEGHFQKIAKPYLAANAAAETVKPKPTPKVVAAVDPSAPGADLVNEPAKPAVVAAAAAKTPEVVTLASYIDAAPPELRDSIREMHAYTQARRGRMVDAIVAHEANEFTAEELQAMGTPMLEKLTRIAMSANAARSAADLINHDPENPNPKPAAATVDSGATNQDGTPKVNKGPEKKPAYLRPAPHVHTRAIDNLPPAMPLVFEDRKSA